ncbi:MAG: NUDIX domain-containing protein [Patescibacteria group bacterium]
MESNKIVVKAMCVVSRNGKEVLAGIGRDDVKEEYFGRIIGGKMEFGETAESALRREFKEELNTDLEELFFIKMVENIFTYNGQNGHEVIFVYKGNLSDKALYQKDLIKVEDCGKKFDVKWVSLDDVYSGKLKLYPEIDYKAILNYKV